MVDIRYRYCKLDMYRLLRAQFSSENIEPPLVGKLTRRGFQRAIICLPQSSFSQVPQSPSRCSETCNVQIGTRYRLKLATQVTSHFMGVPIQLTGRLLIEPRPVI